MSRLKTYRHTKAEILEKAVRVSGHADECTEPLLRKTGQDITRLQTDLAYMQKLIDKELTRRYKELVEKGTP
jgi:hypothetical protein